MKITSAQIGLQGIRLALWMQKGRVHLSKGANFGTRKGWGIDSMLGVPPLTRWNAKREREVMVGKKGYGQSMSFLAYFLTMLSSPKMNRDLLTVKQFCRTGMGLYKAIVRALCAFDCL